MWTDCKKILYFVGYNVQAEYHTENAMTIMLNSVTTTTTEGEKAAVFGVLFRINYIQGKAQIAMKKYNEAETALAKVSFSFLFMPPQHLRCGGI
jgi:hypothetical protein